MLNSKWPRIFEYTEFECSQLHISGGLLVGTVNKGLAMRASLAVIFPSSTFGWKLLKHKELRMRCALKKKFEKKHWLLFGTEWVSGCKKRLTGFYLSCQIIKGAVNGYCLDMLSLWKNKKITILDLENYSKKRRWRYLLKKTNAHNFQPRTNFHEKRKN